MQTPRIIPKLLEETDAALPGIVSVKILEVTWELIITNPLMLCAAPDKACNALATVFVLADV